MANRPIGSIKLGISLDSVKFQNSLEQINAKLKQAESAMRTNMKALGDSGKSYDGLSQHAKDLNSVLGQEDAKIKELTSRRDKAIEKYGAESKQVANLNTQINKVQGQYNAYSHQLDDTRKKMVESEAGVKDVTQAMKDNARQTKEEAAAYRKNGDEVNALKTEQKGYKKQLDLSEQAVKAQEQVVAKLTDEFGENSTEVKEAKEKLDQFKRENKLTGVQVEGFEAKLAKAEKTSKTFAQSMDKISEKAKAAGQKLHDVGQGMATKFTLPIVGAMGAAVKSSMDFDGQMQTVRALLNDGSTKQSTLSKQIKEMGDQSLEWSTKYGISTDSINAGLEEVIKKGYTYQQTMGAMPNILDAAVASGDDFNTVMNVSTSTLEQFGLKVKDTEGTLKNTQRVTDSLTYVANLTASGFTDLGYAMNYIGPVAHSLGMSVEETASAIGLLSNNGIEGAKAGTVLRGALTRLLKPSKQNIEGMSKLGIKSSDFKKGLLDLPTILDKIRKNTVGWTDQQRSAAIALAFGTEAQSGMNVLINQGGDALRKLTKDTKNASGYTKELANQMNDTDKNQLNKFKESIKALSIVFGEQLLPVITPIIEKLTSLVKSFTQIDDGTQRTILVIGSIVAAIGPALMALGSMSKGVGVLTGMMGKLSEAGGLFKIIGGALSFMTGPIGIALIGIVGIGTALIATANKGKSFKETLGSVFNAVKLGIGVLVKLGTAIKDTFSSSVGVNRDGLDILMDMFGPENGRKIRDGLVAIKTTIKKAWGDISSFFMTEASGLIKFWDQNGAQIIQVLKNFWAIVSPIIKVALKVIGVLVKATWGTIKGIISGGVKVIEGIIQVFTGIFTGDFKKMWQGVKNIFSGAIKVIWNWVSLKFIKQIVTGIGGFVKKIPASIKGMWTSVKGHFTGGINKVNTAIASFVRSIPSKIWSMAKNAGNHVKDMWKNIRNLFSGGIKNVGSNIKSFAKDIPNRFKSMGRTIQSHVSDLWKSVRDKFGKGIDWIIAKMKALPGQIADKIKNGAQTVAKAFQKVFDKAVDLVAKPINLVIGGASWVLEKFGHKPLKTWKPKKNYAKGTDGHTGGSAMVNDGNGAELVIAPNGKAFIPQGRNVIFPDMPKGTHVIPAEQTAEIMGYSRPKFAYKGGTGLWENIKSLANSAKGKMKGIVDDVMDFMDKPKDLISKVLDKFVNYEGITHYPLAVSKAFVSTAKNSMLDWVKGLFDEADEGGSFDGSMGAHGVYGYLWDIAKQVMHKFPGMVYTSGYRPGDPYSHGKHMAVDIAYPSSANGSSKYFKPANWAFEHFPSEIAYVITQGKVRDRKGSSGTGVHNGWKIWPDHDHYDHLHLNGSLGAGDIGKGGAGGNIGKVGGSWRSAVIRGLKANGLPTSSAYIKAWLRQINTESGGNPKALGGTDGLADGHATGLLQTKPGTFSAYAFRGHKNIWNGFDNILAAINYAKHRYGKSGMLGVIGHGHGYENGGLIDHHQLIEVGEHNLPEVVIPLSAGKRSRAMELLQYAKNKLGDKEGSVIVNGGSNVDLTETNKKLDTLISLMTQLLGKDMNTYLNATKVNKELDRNKQLNSTNRQRVSGRSVQFA